MAGFGRDRHRERVDRRRLAKIERQYPDVGDPRQIGGGAVGPPRADDDACPGPGERADGFEAEPRIAAGDERDLAGEVDPRDHVGRGRLLAKASADGGLRRHDGFLGWLLKGGCRRCNKSIARA